MLIGTGVELPLTLDTFIYIFWIVLETIIHDNMVISNTKCIIGLYSIQLYIILNSYIQHERYRY